MKTMLVCDNPEKADQIYGAEQRRRIAEVSDFYPVNVTSADFERLRSELAGVEAVFSTWGFPLRDSASLDFFPSLKAVFYAAGSVKHFAGNLLAGNIAVASAWKTNAIPVAEFAASEILLANKGFFRNQREAKSPGRAKVCFSGHGNYGETVAVLGAGQVGSLVIQELRRHNLKILVFDPFLPEVQAQAMGVQKVSLAEAFALAYTVSCHLADVPETRNLIGRELLASMRQDATFINTGRGATVSESALCEVLSERPDLTAVLDVTSPEPPVPDSLLYQLPNVTLTSHIAGSVGDETIRMADCMIEEFAAWQQGGKLRCQVTAEMLEHMA